jgi:hypothetical protein
VLGFAHGGRCGTVDDAAPIKSEAAAKNNLSDAESK